MKSEIEKRLESLQIEYKKGEEQLGTLEQEVVQLKSTILRISGAIQVLQELLATESSSSVKNNEIVSNGDLA